MISVLIPTYKRSLQLRTLLISLFNISCKYGIEVIVCNDGGDNGKFIEGFCKSLTNNGGNYKYICHKENKGIFYVRESLIKAASYDWVKFVDDDDMLDTYGLMQVVSSLGNPNIKDYDIILCDQTQFEYNLNSGCKVFDFVKYYKTKTKRAVTLSQCLLNLGKNRDNIHFVTESLENTDRNKYTGEDQYFLYHILGKRRDPLVFVNHNLVYLYMICRSEEDKGMMGTGKEHYIDNYMFYKFYVPNDTEDEK